MIIDKRLLLAVAGGVVLGAVGYKLYQEHKEQILGSLDSLKKAASGNANDSADLSEEELQLQKERLEDLIAEKQAAKEAN